MIRRIYWLLFCCPFFVHAQLVNIETKRIQSDSTRLVLNADFTFNHTNNSGVTVNQINGTLTSQFKSKDLKKIYMFLGNYQYINSEEENLQNSWFLHSRFNYNFTKKLSYEAFLQNQYNDLLIVQQRHLIGTGLRYKWIDKTRFSAFAGNSYLFEMEYSERAQTTDFNHRNSTYISLAYADKSKKFSITNTVYYQPLYRDLGDFRILEQFRLDLPLKKWLKVFTLYNYYFDSQTPLNTKEYTSRLELGIGFSI